MAPLRVSRLGSRKSEAPDPSLYDKPSDDSDDERQQTFLPTSARKQQQQQQQHQSRDLPPPTSTTTQRKPASNKGKQSSTANESTTNVRRSGRLSNGSSASDSPIKALPPTRRAKKPPPTTTTDSSSLPVPPKSKSTVPKSRSRKERDLQESDDAAGETSRDEDDLGVGARPDVPSTSARPYAPTGKGKRAKPNPPAVVPVPESAPSGTRAPSSFVPRAAGQARAGSKLVARAVFTNGDTEDSDTAIPFSTEPPTPHAASSKRTASHVAVGSRQSKMNRTAGPTTPNKSGDSTGSVITVETPTIIKNIMMRNGEMGTPAKGKSGPGGSARRSSARSEGSGKRGSSIGSGYEAVPHPDVPDDRLYRSTEANMPIARRLRTILSWVTQRQRDRIFPQNNITDPTTAFAKDIVEEFVRDICASRVDTAVSYEVAVAGPASGSAALPPHPQNLANATKMAELQATTAKINDEFNQRNVVLAKYQDFEAQGQAASAEPPPLPSSLKFDLTQSGPSTLEEALALGHSLSMGEGGGPETPAAKKAGKKGKGRETDESADSEELVEMRLRTANFKQLTHQLSGFTSVASAYVEARMRQTHLALSADSNRGLLPGAADSMAGGDDSLGGIAAVLRGANAGLSPQVDTTSRGPDGRDLLRAIAHADTAPRNTST